MPAAPYSFLSSISNIYRHRRNCPADLPAAHWKACVLSGARRTRQRERIPGSFCLHDFAEIVGLSIGVSLAATTIALAFSLPIGAALAIFHFRGRRLIVVLINALFGLPPVVVGLARYLAFSHSGPLGFLDLLFTPAAMVTARTMLAVPIITAPVHRASERAWARYGDELISDGASRTQAIPQILSIIRADLLTAILAGFGRSVSC
jgi:tungstate transport system permease protein